MLTITTDDTNKTVVLKKDDRGSWGFGYGDIYFYRTDSHISFYMKGSATRLEIEYFSNGVIMDGTPLTAENAKERLGKILFKSGGGTPSPTPVEVIEGENTADSSFLNKSFFSSETGAIVVLPADLPVGFGFTLTRYGAGLTSLVPTGIATVNQSTNMVMIGEQNQTVTVKKVSLIDWAVSGEVEVFTPVHINGLMAWYDFAKGTNDAPDRDTIKDFSGNEKNLIASNFAWNTVGSGYKEGALYFDGVDDYLYLENFTAGIDDFTVFIKRKILYDNIAAERWSVSHLFKNSNESALSFERHPNPGNSGYTILSFGNSSTSEGNNTFNIQNYLPALVSYATKTNYAGNPINAGTYAVNEPLNLIIGTHSTLRLDYCIKMALHEVAIFDRSLSSIEIKQMLNYLK